MATILRAFRVPALAIILLLLGLFLFLFLHLLSETAHAANPQIINFQGKVVNSDGTNVANGSYDFDFILYDDPSAGTNRWQETWNSGTSQITVTNGVFQVNLGTHTALPNFNTYPNLYLAIRFNNDAAGYMTPRVRLTSVPYALNSDNLAGLGAANFVQLAQGVQTDSSTTNPSIGINKTGGTANILQLQKAGSDVLRIDNSGYAYLSPSSLVANNSVGITQTYTTANATVNGVQVGQYIDISNTGNTVASFSTTALHIQHSDNGTVANKNYGININLSGSNTAMGQIGIASAAARGIGITATSTGISGINQSCGGVNTTNAVGLCAGAIVSSGVSATGIYSRTSGASSGTIDDSAGTGVYGTATAVANAGQFVTGVKGVTSAESGTNAYTSTGVYGQASGNANATTYGGYFTFESASAATNGAALYASNNSTSAKIFQLQDGTTDVMTVANGGTANFKNQTNSATAFVIQNATAADTLFTVDTTARSASGGNLIKIGNSTGTDGDTTIFIVDHATADPTSNLSALNGGLFYNSTSHKLSIVENGTVKVLCNTTDAGCGAGGSSTLQTAYEAGNTITTQEADGDISFTLADTTTDHDFIVNMQGTGNTVQFQDAGTAYATFSDGGFIALQPSANMTAGQTHITQTLTNASSSGGTVQGYSQTITVNNTTSLGTTNGFNIAVNDNSSLVNNNNGLNINMAGSNTSARNVGVNVTSAGIGLKANGSGTVTHTCGNASVTGVGVCGTSSSDSGLFGTTTSNGTSLTGGAGTAVYGYSNPSGTASSYYKGVVGSSVQTANSIAYTSIGVFGNASYGSGATGYGGYFQVGSNNGSALFATNLTTTSNIFQLQDATGSAADVFLVADGGAVTISPKGNNIGTIIKQTSGTATSGNVFDVQTANGSSSFIQIANSAANEGAVTIQSVGATRALTLGSGSGTIIMTAATLQRAANAFAIDLATAAASTMTITNSDASNVASLSVEGDISVGTGQVYKVGSTSGSSISACGAGEYVASFASTGGLVTGGTCTTLPAAGATSLDDAYNQAGATGNTITLTAAGDGVIIQDASTTVGGNLFAVQENTANGGAALFAVTTGGFTVDNLSSEDALTLDTSAATPHLKVHGDDPLEFVDIYYDSTANVAYFGASTGTATLGSGTGSVNIAAGASAAVTITGNAASTISTTAGNLTLQGGSGTVTLGSSTILTASGALTLKPGSSSATAFQLQSSGSVNYLTLDSTNTRLQIGSSTTDATAVLLVLDSYNSGTDPSGVAGAMYYNTSTNKFRCYQNATWTDCISAGTAVKSGSVSVTEGTAQSVNFTTSFGSTPQCSATASSSGYAFVTAVSTSSVTVDWNNATGGGAATATIYWICTTAGNS